MTSFPTSLVLLAMLAVSAAPPLAAEWGVAKDARLEAHEGGLHVEAQDGAVIETAATLDWTRVGSLELSLHSEREVTIDMLLVEDDRSAWYWRRVDLASGDNKLSLPLAWFRWSDGTPVPDWSEVERVAIRFRDEADLVLGALATEPGSPLLGAEQLASVAEVPFELAESDAVTLLWDATDLDATVLTAHLGRVAVTLEGLLPGLPAPPQPPALVVLRDRVAYRHCAVRLALGFDADLGFPGSDGFTLQGVGLGYWDPAQGSLRPSYTHEYVHAWLAGSAGLPSGRGDWFHEGLAALVQLRFHPQPNLPDIVCQGLTDERYRLPLAELMGGHRLPTNRYWQAATLVDHLLEQHPDAVPGLLEALGHEGGAEVWLQHGLGMDVETLERAWLEDTQDRYCGS
jgi:hypothetical protein